MSIDFTKTTRKNILPYEFILLPNQKVCILKTNGQRLHVSKAEVLHVLQREDLDTHRRKMYEAALEVWKKNEVKQ